MLGNLIRKESESVIQDVLIVFSDNGTADIATIIEISDERILALGEVEYAVPLGDSKAFIGRRGRIFCYPSTAENITDVKRIAALERTTVLRQITLFEKEARVTDLKKPIGKYLIIGLILFIGIILLVVKK